MVEKIITSTWNIPPESKKYDINELFYILQELYDEEGKKYFDAKQFNALKGYSVYKNFVKHLLYRNLANFDSMILLTSDKGYGKSSAAIVMAREWCRLIGIKFNPKRHIAYNNVDMLKKIDELNPFEPLLADESIRFACLSSEVLIKIGKNKFVKIKDLEGKRNFKVMSFNEETYEEESKIATACIKTKIDDVYEITTEDGKSIKATKEHLFMMKDGSYKRLKDLQVGDELK